MCMLLHWTRFALARKLYPQIPGTTWPHATASLLFDAAKNRLQVNRAYSLQTNDWFKLCFPWC